MSGIRAEFWIDCDVCGHESVMVENVPSTGIQPRTKSQAWEAARSVGWSGTPTKPRCPKCSEAAVDELAKG